MNSMIATGSCTFCLDVGSNGHFIGFLEWRRRQTDVSFLVRTVMSIFMDSSPNDRIAQSDYSLNSDSCAKSEIKANAQQDTSTNQF